MSRSRRRRHTDLGSLSAFSQQLQLHGSFDGAYAMRRTQLLADQSGAAAVELALTAPAFVLLLAGVLGCGLLMWTMLGLQHAVEMAARCATIDTTVCDTTSTIQA